MHTNRILILALVALAACDSEALVAPSQTIYEHEAAVPAMGRLAVKPWAATAHELAQARAATGRYQDLDTALDEGFLDIDVFIPGMGHHFLNPDRLDATFDPAKPELLVYAREHGHMRLVAVEYAVPTALAAEPPEGFTGDADVWDENLAFELWTLHAWVWRHNPAGVFAPLNTRVP
jgi:hypothetical protein